MMRGRARWWWLGLALIGAAIACVFFLSSSPSLLQRAARVALCDTADQDQEEEYSGFYTGPGYWLSSHKVTIWRAGKAYVHEVRTGRDTPFDRYLGSLSADRKRHLYRDLLQRHITDQNNVMTVLIMDKLFNLQLTSSRIPGLPAVQQIRLLAQHLPSHNRVEAMETAPDGKRRAWLLQVEYRGVLETYLHHLFPFYSPQPQRSVALYVSAYDGSRIQQIGAERIRPEPQSSLIEPEDHSAFPVNYCLHWLPDSRHVSFVYQSVLYSIPVPTHPAPIFR